MTGGGLEPDSGEPRASGAIEIVQTREFTAREKQDLTRLWGKIMWREGAGDIEPVINDRDRVVALLPGYGGIFMVKAAFDGQDVEGFGAQLTRMWQEHRKDSQPESAS